MKIANADKLKKHFESVVDVKLFTVPNILTIIDTFSSEVDEGEWVRHPSDSLNDMGYSICSKCKHGFKRFDRGIRKSDVPYIDGQSYELHNIDKYCPNCGAKMRNGGKKT